MYQNNGRPYRAAPFYVSNTIDRKGGVMAYTPELSHRSSCVLRRVAWALNVPMTEAMEMIFEKVVSMLDTEKVCAACRDKTKCSDCLFRTSEMQTKEEGHE